MVFGPADQQVFLARYRNQPQSQYPVSEQLAAWAAPSQSPGPRAVPRLFLAQEAVKSTTRWTEERFLRRTLSSTALNCVRSLPRWSLTPLIRLPLMWPA